MSVDDLIKILQASIAPVVLISGVGMILLSLTNRLARSIDRIRTLCQESGREPKKDLPFLKRQVDVLYHRCQILRMAIVFAICSIISTAIIIFVLFSIYILKLNLMGLVECLFVVSLVCLISSLFLFLQDIFATLHSIRIEIDRAF